MSFAAFVMTYKRPAILEDTIQKLFSQSLPPQKILIVDNDPGKSAEEICRKFPGQDISYFPVGYNSGPAGAAYHGLKILAAEGWGWIGWIDDDDPPIFNDTFERLINLGNAHKRCACVGVVGHRLNRKTGLIERLGDHELEGDGFIKVDNIAGNMSKIVNGTVIASTGILPDESLFFGFEELAFDLDLKKAGFSLLVENTSILRHRTHFKRLGLKIRGKRKRDITQLWREYYSVRNSLFIYKANKMSIAVFLSFSRHLLKGLYGFRYGLIYGSTQLRYIHIGLLHFMIGKMGAMIIPKPRMSF